MYNGIINIYKEKGFTSHDAVAKLRGILKQKKIGHTGTLDPDASGVLPVCLGKGTKLCGLLTDKEKVYHAVMVLGKATDTQDISGKIIAEDDIAKKRGALTDEKIKESILSFEGEYSQLPPMYSAVRVNGRHLYELAREGEEIDREPRKVNINYIKNIEINYPEIRMEVGCSKGTYIRTLCHDIGIRLGTFGCMTFLERLRSGIFTIDTALTLAQTEELVRKGTLDSHIMPIDSMFMQYKSVRIGQTADGGLLKLLHNGNPFTVKSVRDGIEGAEELSEAESVRVYDENGEFKGVYRVNGGLLKPEKLF